MADKGIEVDGHVEQAEERLLLSALGEVERVAADGAASVIALVDAGSVDNVGVSNVGAASSGKSEDGGGGEEGGDSDEGEHYEVR